MTLILLLAVAYVAGGLTYAAVVALIKKRLGQ